MNLDKCIVTELPTRFDDRGSLTFLENNRHIPFAIKRIYYLYAIANDAQRGAHAHRCLEQFIIPVSGGFDITLDDGKNRKKLRLDNPSSGLYICPMIWRELDNFSSNTVCLVLASEFYDESDYFREYSHFLKTVNLYDSSISGSTCHLD